MEGGEEDRASDSRSGQGGPDECSDAGHEDVAVEEKTRPQEHHPEPAQQKLLQRLQLKQTPRQQEVDSAGAVAQGIVRSTPPSQARAGLSSWESEGTSEAVDSSKVDRLEQVKAELSEVIMQQMQRLARMMQEENAKLKKQIEVMPQVICLRLHEKPLVQDGSAPARALPRAGSLTMSEGQVAALGAGTIQDLQREVRASPQPSESGWSSDDLSAVAGSEAGRPGRPPRGRRTPQEKPQLKRRQALPLVPVAREQQSPRTQRDQQRRLSPMFDSQRTLRPGFPPLPHQLEHRPMTNESGLDQPCDPRASSEVAWEERGTHNSNFSSLTVNPGTVQSLRGLDDFLTNSIFESHGLLPSRPSFGARQSFSGDRVGQSGRPPIDTSFNSMKALFWRTKPESSSAVPSSSPCKVTPSGSACQGDLQGAPTEQEDSRISAHQVATPKPAPPGAPDDFVRIHLEKQPPLLAGEATPTEPERYTPSEAADGGSLDGSYVDDCGGPRLPAARGMVPRSEASAGSWGPSRLAQRFSSAIMPAPSAMDRLRIEREDGLIEEQVRRPVSYLNSAEAAQEWEEAQRRKGRPFASFALAAMGITPMGTGRGNWIWGNLVLVALVLLLTAIVTSGKEHRVGTSMYFTMVTGTLAFSGFFGLVSLRIQKLQDLLGPRRRPLEFYACVFGFWDSWHRMSKKCLTVVLALWFVSTFSQALMNLQFQCPQSGESSFSTCVINFSVLGLVFGTFYCKLHICCSLELAIDHYCIRFFENQDLPNGIVEWNVMQAMLRRAAHVVEAAFVSVSTGVLGIVVLTSVEFVKMFGDASAQGLNGFTAKDAVCMGLWTTWIVPLVALVFYFVFRAAAITEKCNRVPALVNSWMLTERHIDHEKQYVVQYIMHSAAGYYVMGARLNATWALKLSYLFGVLLFSLLTQSVLKAS